MSKKRRSLKKSLGTLGTIVFYILSLYGGYKIPSMIPQILGVLAVLIAAFFSIKKYGGNISTHVNTHVPNHTEEK